MLERDGTGRVRTKSLTDHWEPAFGEISEEEARAYVIAELRYTLRQPGQAAWWGWKNPRLDGRTPDEAFAEGQYRPVWLAAVSLRMMEMS
jgi:hypothetical protein